MIKKFISILVTVMLLISQLSCLAATSDTFKDIEESSHKRAIEVLYNLNLVNGDENGNFNPDKEITRVEFLAMVIRMIGQEASAKALATEALPFADVSEDHWGRGYIYFAYKMGIANGMSDNEFGPGLKVTYNQAIKMIVSSLGYGVVAEKKGGWPVGYLSQAVTLDLTNGVSSKERELKREEVARLILNGVTVPMRELINDEFVQTRTPLETMGYKKYNGVVTSTFEAQTSQKKINEDSVAISGVVYETSYFVDAELLGASVIYYTEDIGGGTEIVRYLYQYNDDDAIDVDADDIEDATTLSEFVYYEGDKVRKESLAGSSLTVVYNGKYAGSSYYEGGKILKPASGNVSLRDSDNDGVYDIAIVNEYETVVVSAVSDNDIFDIYGNNISLDMKDDQISVYKDGAKASLQMIESGDVLSVAQSKDKSKLIVYIVNNSFTGTVEAIREENNKTLYEINVDGEVKDFSVTLAYRNAQNANRSSAAKFAPGDTGIFYLNYLDEIAYCKLTEKSADMTYGYVLNAKTENNLDNTSSFKMLTHDNKITTFDAETEIYFGRMSGGKYVRSRESASEAAKYITKDVEIAKQICSYRLNDEGLIEELQFADTTGANNEYLSCTVNRESLYYSQNLLDHKYVVDQNTTVFYVPSYAEYEDVIAAGKYNSFLKQGNAIVSVYDVKNNHAGAIVITPLTVQRYDMAVGEYETIIDNVNSPVMYIQSVSTVKGDDDESYMRITGIEDGEIVEVKVADTLNTNSQSKSLLVPGVAIQYEKNDLTRSRALTSDEESVLVLFKVVYDFNKEQPMQQTYNYTTAYKNRPQISVIHSRVTAVEPSFIAVEHGDKAAPLSGGTVYMRYNANSKQKFDLINSAQVSIGQEIMLRLRYLNTREVVVIE